MNMDGSSDGVDHIDDTGLAGEVSFRQ